jgi:Ca-activated chloride channel family protein
MKKMIFLILSAVLAGVFAPGLSGKTHSGMIILNVESDRKIYQAREKQSGIVRITITAPEPGERVRKSRMPLNLSVIIDRSGSMSGQKIEKAKEAAITAVNMLSAGDIFSLVAYNDQVSTVIPSVFVDDKEHIIAKIRAINSDGSTALFAGVSSGAAEIRKNISGRYVNRIILLSDGLANIGPSSPEELGRLGASLVKEGISVSTVGVGNGYNEDLMTALSQNSDGNFYFVENSNDLPMIFAKELDSALVVVAKAVKLRIQCPEGIKPFGIIGYDCKINGSSIDMLFNQLYGGNSKTLLLQVEVPSKNSDEIINLASVSVKYRDPRSDVEISAFGEASVSFSGVKEKVEKSRNVEVLEDYAMKQNAALKEEAIRQADSGDMSAASATMRKSAENLKTISKLGGNIGLMKEAEKAEKDAEEMEVQAEAGAKNLDSNVRKKLKKESYQEINDQKFKQ